MRIDIATLFPDMCETVLNESIVGRARKAEKIELHCHQIRDYSNDKHRRVDDTPYGGGMGMVMQAEPIYRCYLAVAEQMGAKTGFAGILDTAKAKAIELKDKLMAWLYEGVEVDNASTVTGSLVQVETGLQNDDYVEIVSGLSDGDVIYYTIIKNTSTTTSPFGMGGMGGGMPGGMGGMPAGGMSSGGMRPSGMSGGMPGGMR